MNQFLTTHIEQAFERQAIIGLELIDGVTLERVYRGIRVQAAGLVGEPQINRSGIFYWRRTSNVQVFPAITIDPNLRQFEPVTIGPFQLLENSPTIHRVELVPRNDYPFPSGTTGLLGQLVLEKNVAPLVPIPNAKVALQAEIDGVWVTSRLSARCNSRGEFAATLRMPATAAPSDDPPLTAYKLRLEVQRDQTVRVSQPWEQSLGTLVVPSIANSQLFAWNSLT